ncbi:MAG: ATP-binding protein [Verrucomicrobiae bacterium]|nr:ATP-binding protein [Verrucomicrobiae bacterium]
MSDTEVSTKEGPEAQPELFFDDRFWEQYVGTKLVHDPVIAIVELVANCWDAGAKDVRITWPEEGNSPLEVIDDGEGMTKAEFYRRWGGMSYDRVKNQGTSVEVQIGGVTRIRKVFGRNGIGRFAGFCFASEYQVATAKEGTRNVFLVKKGRTQPLDFDHLKVEEAESTGTTITIRRVNGSTIRPETVRTELGRRFLTDPAFQVSVNGVKIAFDDIEDKGLEKILVPVPSLGTEIEIKVIDAQRTDPTGRQHGVAWHVLGRLVGDCGWKDPEQRSLIDGRRVEAKRFTFIVEADLLQEAGAVKPDWSGFEEENETFVTVNAAVQEAITKRLLEVTKEKRDETTANVRRSHAQQVKQMSPIRREQWNLFVEKVAEECPSLTETELKSVSGVLASMEVANSQFGLLHKLHQLSPDQIDDLHQILDDWTVGMAKIVLDEIQGRMQLIEELRIKTADDSTLEVQELQPLFRQGLWIFGPEFETIHYTSNQGMTTVIQELIGVPETKGSLKRPDFAILPDGTVGLYSYPEFDDEGAEIGVAKLVILELKAPDVPITDKEKQQCWGYVRELHEKGLLGDRTKVQGFVLGRRIKPIDRSESTHLDGRVRILPLDFSTVLQRADSRLLKLREKIKSAPFLQDKNLEEFVDDESILTGELPLTSSPV